MFNIREFVEFNFKGRGYCPSCELKKGRRPSQRSLAVLDSGAYKCHAGCSAEEIYTCLRQSRLHSLTTTPTTLPSRFFTREEFVRQMTFLLDSTQVVCIQARKWLQQRGITTSIIRHYQLGLVVSHGLTGITIPISASELGLKYFQKVRIQPWNGNKAWSQRGVPATVYFTYKPEQASQTYLCEGEWDAILLGWSFWKAGIADTAIATFTCGCNTIPPIEQLQYLPGKVTIFYDQDEPGQKGAEKLAHALGERGWIAQVPCQDPAPPKGWDISDALNAGHGIEDLQAAARTATCPTLDHFPTSKKSKLSYERCMERIEEILQVEDAARQLWELHLLAKLAELSIAQLRKMYQTRLEYARPFSPVDVADFLSRTPAKREWIIAGKIPKGSTIALIADGGLGKSRLGYDLAYAVATGRPWNGFFTIQGKVLIIQTDEPDVDFSNSLRDASYSKLGRGLVQVETEWQFSQMQQLIRWIEIYRPLLVIIDSFTSANRTNELDEKDTSYGACIYDLRDVANIYGCTFLILHHTNKLGGSRGTTAIPDNVSEVWYLRHPKPEDNLPPGQRIWSIEKSRSGCSGKFVIGYDPDECTLIYHGDHNSTSNGQGSLEVQLLEHFQRSAGVPYEIEELALQFSSSETHIRRLVKRLWRQGQITEEIREVSANNGRGGRSRKKVFISPKTNDQVTENQAGKDLLSLDQDRSKDDQVTKTLPDKGSLSLDHPSSQIDNPSTHSSIDLRLGNRVEILTGYFAGKHVEIIGFPLEKPGWVEVKGKNWAITHQYQQDDLRLLGRV